MEGMEWNGWNGMDGCINRQYEMVDRWLDGQKGEWRDGPTK